MNLSTPGLPVRHQLPEFTQTHVHRVSGAIQPSQPVHTFLLPRLILTIKQFWKLNLSCKFPWRKFMTLFYTHKHTQSPYSVHFSCSVMSDSLWPHGLQHIRLPCPSPSPGASSNSCPLCRECHPTISSLLSPSPLTFNLAQHQGLFQWVDSAHQVAKVLELQHQSFQWIFRAYFL